MRYSGTWLQSMAVESPMAVESRAWAKAAAGRTSSRSRNGSDRNTGLPNRTRETPTPCGGTGAVEWRAKACGCRDAGVLSPGGHDARAATHWQGQLTFPTLPEAVAKKRRDDPPPAFTRPPQHTVAKAVEYRNRVTGVSMSVPWVRRAGGHPV